MKIGICLLVSFALCFNCNFGYSQNRIDQMEPRDVTVNLSFKGPSDLPILKTLPLYQTLKLTPDELKKLASLDEELAYRRQKFNSSLFFKKFFLLEVQKQERMIFTFLIESVCNKKI